MNAIFAKDAVAVSGPLTDYVSAADSGSIMHRRFCAKCGTTVFSEAEPRPDQIIVRVGTLDDPNLAKPGGIIWTKSVPGWACFDPGLPQTEAQPTASREHKSRAGDAVHGHRAVSRQRYAAGL